MIVNVLRFIAFSLSVESSLFYTIYLKRIGLSENFNRPTSFINLILHLQQLAKAISNTAISTHSSGSIVEFFRKSSLSGYVSTRTVRARKGRRIKSRLQRDGKGTAGRFYWSIIT
jgi:hypothetical protein